jgi:hypothetical protein
MSPFNRFNGTLKRLQENGCELNPTVKEFLREYKEQTKKVVQKLNAEHSQELEKQQNLF